MLVQYIKDILGVGHYLREIQYNRRFMIDYYDTDSELSLL
jgi:hypothetical protein